MQYLCEQEEIESWGRSHFKGLAILCWNKLKCFIYTHGKFFLYKKQEQNEDVNTKALLTFI